ncbi:ATP-binding protein [Novipirellula artificiosorum]|uniref:histidine kinase n=1 Tax=Novipirellula artificiosorum TaxID=2528016 RepID=A0A5C6D9I3_9BACT|nr:ATP-binding protein [Novipirellula artificiosorum]TWU32454.1 Sensor protein ZraS [Novipirellula artificiosorum]
MTLREKVGCFLPMTGLILLCFGFSGAWYVIKLQRQNSRLLDVNVASIRAAEELERLVLEMRHELDRYLLTKNREHLLHAVQTKTEADEWMSSVRQLSASEQEAAFVSELENGLEVYFLRLNQLIDDSDATTTPLAVETLAEETLSSGVLVVAHDYLKFNEQELQQSNQQHQRLAEKVALVMVLLGLCGAIAGLEAGYLVARRMSQQRQKVVRADQFAAVGKLAAGLAHELRNPLMCMKTLVQSARRTPSDASLNATDIAVLDEEITRVNSLLQSFLDFARPSDAEIRSVELSPIVRQTVDLVSSRAVSRRITIDTQLPNESVAVRGDAMQLRQVLLNLLLNALDAVPNEGKITVTVQSLCRDGGSAPIANHKPSTACLKVADNGCGLPAGQRDRLFEPFFSTKDPGLGLGLAICRRIVDEHGGQISAQDLEGGGTVFTVVLPLS